MRTRNSLAVVSSVCGMFLTYQSTFAQGSLTPPGAPAPTMKTLEQIEPRTAISSLPFTITGPGSYFITTNLAGVSGQAGITILSTNVTLDLRGFTLAGAPGSMDGIFASNANSLTIRNGKVSGWGSNGVNADAVFGGNYIDLVMTANGNDGIDPGNNGLIVHCSANNNSGNGVGGFAADDTFESCVAHENGEAGFSIFEQCTVENCSANNNGADGFNPFPSCVFRGCNASGNGFDGFDTPYTGCVLVDCVANNDGSVGIITSDECTVRGCTTSGCYNGIVTGSHCVIESCSASANNDLGIVASNFCTLTDCTADSNFVDNVTTAFGCALSQCVAGDSQTGNGFTLGSGNQISSSSAFQNTLDGIDAADRTSVQNCTATFNGNAGIHVNFQGSVQQCTSGNNGFYGILSDASGYATISHNNCSFNGLTSFGGTPMQGAGIYISTPGCSVERNTVNINFVGVQVTANNSALVTGNSAQGNVSTAYSFATGNSWGPIVNVAGAGDISSTPNANQPTANFIH